MLVFSACKQEEDYKKVRDEVMDFHDEVMNDNGHIVNNQMKLDTLLHQLKSIKTQFPAMDTLQEAVMIKSIIKELNHAEELMNDWMHKFEPDATGKSNAEAVKYFKSEKARVAQIDSLYKQEILSSDTYLSKFEKL
jgi:GTPase involved in cell partitioning and DNA repair